MRPAPTAGAGPEGLHSRPVLHNAEGKTLFLAIAAGEEALDHGRSRTVRRQDTTYGDSSGTLGGRRGIQGTRLTGGQCRRPPDQDVIMAYSAPAAAGSSGHSGRPNARCAPLPAPAITISSRSATERKTRGVCRPHGDTDPLRARRSGQRRVEHGARAQLRSTLVNCCQTAAENARRAPWGFLESRTARTPSATPATSTQAPEVPLRLLRRHATSLLCANAPSCGERSILVIFSSHLADQAP